MKVLRVISSMNPKYGGPCQGIRNSIPEMKRIGVENDVVCMDSSSEDYLENDDFNIYAIGEAKNAWAYSKELVPWLLENFHNYDVVIVHGLWLYHSYAVYKAWSRCKKNHEKYPKLYVMPHGMLDPYFQRAKGRRLKAIRNWLYWKLIEGKVINNANGVLFTTKEELKLARTTFTPYLPKKEMNIGYGIARPPYFNQKMSTVLQELIPSNEEKPYLLFLSRVHEKKGIDLLIKAYVELKKTEVLPDLVIAGPGSDSAFGKYVRSLANDEPNIHFVGMLQGDAKWAAFYGCEAFILPSHQENFGIAVVEAMACGKAILTTDKVNIWREIADANAGIIVEDEEEAIYEQLRQWIALSGLEKIAMGERAKQAYEAHFSIEKAALKMKIALEENN